MRKSQQYLFIGSTEAYSGKSATILGIAHQLKNKGLDIVYGKPVSNCFGTSAKTRSDADVKFISEILALSKSQVRSPILFLDEETIAQRLRGNDQNNYSQALATYTQNLGRELVLLEGPANLYEGSLFNLSLPEMAATLDAAVLLVTRFESIQTIDAIIEAKQRLNSHLLGVVLNDIPAELMEIVYTNVKPFLEKAGIPILGILPRSALLRSVSVHEIVRQLNAEVLCRSDRLDFMVESLQIGAMNVNSAMQYFSKGKNMAVVTGGDRTDIQLAALDTSTHCLILTGHLAPSPLILNRAEDLEIPILSVNSDTLTTVKIIERTFGKVPLAEPIKAECICQLMIEHFDINTLLNAIGLLPAVTA